MSMAPQLGAGITSLGGAMPIVRELARKEYTPRSTHFSAKKLEQAADDYVDKLKPGASVDFDLGTPTPQGETFLDRAREVLDDPSAYAGSTPPSKDPAININPKASRELYAHELGHLASQQTDVGHLVASLRENPKLKNALLAATLTLPGAAAVLEQGDEDLDTSLALAFAATAPTILDEGLATKHALGIMDEAGMRASLGQRGRLAGGLLSYLAVPALMAVGGNIVGNQFD